LNSARAIVLSFDEDTSNDETQINITKAEDLNLLFGDNFLEKKNLKQQNIPISTDILKEELTEKNSELQQSFWEIDQQDVISDLLAIGIGLNENLGLPAAEVTQPEAENLTSIELSTNQDLFIETANANEFEEINVSNSTELERTTPHSDGLSFDNLFAGTEENTILPTDESEIGDLFDALPTVEIEFSQTDDDLSNFWNPESDAKQQSEFDLVIEQDIAKALEESLFTAASSGEIFGDEQSTSSPTANFDLEEFDISFEQPEQLLDLILPSDTADDFFGDLIASNSTISPTINDDDITLQEICSFSQEPEALDFTPEFTNQSTDESFVNYPQTLAEPEIDLFDALGENGDENLEDKITKDHSTYIQPFGDLFASETEQLATLENTSDSPETVEDINTSLEAIADFPETDDLFASETEQPVTLEELGGETNEDDALEDLDFGEFGLNLETDENLAEVTQQHETYIQDEFADLEALLGEEVTPNVNASFIAEEDFAALEALLGEDDDEEVTAKSHNQPSQTQQLRPGVAAALPVADEFSDLEKLLAEADQTISHSSAAKQNIGKIPRPSARRTAKFEETMKVPVKQLDDMSNLVGELVVNRNTLEQDHERLRQSLDNLLVQVQQLSDVGARMQELYERSLLEASLLASRKSRESPKEISFHSENADTDRGFSELEMDRFTPFHTLSQEMIELIVRVRESASDIDFVTEETERVARQFRQVTTQLQEGLTRARMVPFSQTIDRLRRGVRDNAIKYGKQVELIIEGGDTLIDKMILDHLTDPLTHMLNNAIAHGIETPEIRQAAGKPPVGEITIRAFHQGNQTVISVGDDGAGIDTQRIKSKAIKLDMITAEQAKTISRMEVYDLLFQSGFSIKDQADEISGRGVGMDVVRSEISEIRGTVNTDSTLSKGTTFTIRLPLTLSICKALCCVSDKARVAFPMDGVEDTLDIPVKNIQHSADGQSFISWRDTVLPFRPLKELLTFNRQIIRGSVYGGTRDDDMVSVIVVRSGNTLIALQIDLVLSEQEIVIKQFEGPAPKPIGVAGATVLGDGRIMPIADVLEIIDIFQGRISKHTGGTLWQQKGAADVIEIQAVKIDPTVLIVDDSITVRELLSLTFNKAGYRVEQARDGQEAWDKLRSGLPCDIVFCDIEMPRCDGLELLSRIQKDSSLNHLPIAMLTSRGADKHRQMAIQLGASGYFTKPYLEEALLEAAVRMLKGEKLVNSNNG
jgi:chemotaxis protein histidine kinase CheA/CheY-like chemotaxis protein